MSRLIGLPTGQKSPGSPPRSQPNRSLNPALPRAQRGSVRAAADSSK
ncbi:hypothetical protein ACFPRL_07025 [Pseudoclavibacter helvolus]